ncbi:hypothetical protein P2318_15010 [Myxococcaceae bacterium GXIMD 01537]
MTVLDKVLTLRPGNAVARLGPGSRLPMLNPRELLRALEGSPAALPCVPLLSKAALPGLLRGARSEDAVLGLACPHPLADRGAPERFVTAVRVATSDADAEHIRPVFLQAGPMRVARGDAEALAALQEGLFRVVDAGFSLVSLDVSRLPAAEAVEAVRAVVGPALERELALEVSAPEGASLAEAAGELLEGLRRARVPVAFLRVPAAALGEGEPDVALLREVVEAAARAGARVSVSDVPGASVRLLPTYVAAGARKVDCTGPFERLALEAWPPEAREQVRSKAGAAGLAAGELLSVLEEQLPPLEAAARERLEALSFAEATDLLAALGAAGTGWRAMSWLAEHRGGE